ncbi:MAG: hydantoinase/oxoprolinase family protein [Pseudomonadota bacterium]
MAHAQLRVAVDIGGTFTDLQVMDTGTGRVWDHKTPSTPEDPSIGLIEGLTGAVAKAWRAMGDIGVILHGSTIATNAVLERRLPKGALITTQGFEDVLAIGRHMRSDVYALLAEPRPVLIPEARRFGVAERVRANGTIETAMDEGAVRALGTQLRDQGIQTVAVVFLHAFRTPDHEIRAAQILGELGLTVATSHETSPEIREYERASTTVLNALLKPVMSDYLARVEGRLQTAGIAAPLFLVQSNGGVATPDEAARLPVRLILSGPSGGAMAVAGRAAAHGLGNVVGVDMGGTSTDVSVVIDGRIEETQAGVIDGLPVRLPMIEIRTIGAGGGSLARLGGGLRVGPESAGARPGPACYGRGGTEPTVTDANLALGRIDPAAFLGGEMALDAAAARDAIGRLAADLGSDTDSTAAGILHIADAAMAGAVRLSLFEKGADPQDFTLMAFGGAGGLHACQIAEELDMSRVLFPAMASTLSARGILGSDLRHDLLIARLMLADSAALPDLTRIVGDLRADGTARLTRDGIPADEQRVEIAADARYRGQAYEITTPWELEGDHVDAAAMDRLCAAFHRLHQARYAHSAQDDAIEIVAVRARALGLTGSTPDAAEADTPAATTDTPAIPQTSTRAGWTPEGWAEIPCRPRDSIGKAPLSGPLIIEEAYSALWIGPGWAVRALGQGDLLAVNEAAK